MASISIGHGLIIAMIAINIPVTRGHEEVNNCDLSHDIHTCKLHCWFDTVQEKCASCHIFPCNKNIKGWERNCQNVCPETYKEIKSRKVNDDVTIEPTSTVTPISSHVKWYNSWFWIVFAIAVVVILLIILVVVLVYVSRGFGKDKKDFQQMTKKGRIVTKDAQAV